MSAQSLSILVYNTNLRTGDRFNFKSLKWKKVLAQQEPKRVPWNAVKSSWTERPQLEQADWRGRTELPHVLLAVHRKLDGKRFNEWWPRMKDMLRGAGLLSYAILPPGKGRGAPSSWSEKSALAAQWVLAYVSSDTYSIVPLDCRQDAYALLRLLRQFTGPFRFMDLPRELRDHIYKILLIKSTDPKEARCIAQCIDVIDTHPMNYFLRRRLFRPARRPSLIHVSHQVRTEALHIYYAKNAFCMQLGRHTVGGNNNAAAIIARWAKQVGIETLGELRDLTVNIKCFHEQVIDIRVTYSPEKGLSHQVDGHETRSSESHREHSRTIRQQCIKYEQKQKRTRMDEYLSVIEERRKRKGGDGRTVIDYFTADPDALRLAYWGPPGHFEEDSVTFVEDEADRLTWVMW